MPSPVLGNAGYRYGANTPRVGVLALSLLVFATSPALGQARSDSTGLILGVTAGIANGSREVFDNLATGYGAQFFIGGRFSTPDELRLGVAVSSHSDDLIAERAELLSVYVETYFIRDISTVRLRFGPRVAYMRVSRDVFTNTLNGFGVGGVVGMQFRVSSKSAIETGVVLTLLTFGGADTQFGTDPDDESFGSVWELRLGWVFSPN